MNFNDLIDIDSNENDNQFKENKQNYKSSDFLEENTSFRANAELPAKWLGSKFQIMKFLLVIGTAWMFQFTAYQSMANLQSSLNSDEGLGTASLSSIYISLIVSCLFLPPILIKNIGIKWSIVICQFTYLLFIAANMYPKWWLLIPGSNLIRFILSIALRMFDFFL
jgi:hypothetical protein